MKSYFKIQSFAILDQHRISGTHIIKANSARDALRIFNQHNIRKIPDDVTKITQYVENLKHIKYPKNYMNWVLDRRKRGIGGNIWYEDENGKLQKEVKE
jgi:D-arabinose 1-dehydrogenase-like Zn-dependent alcohol dehydrogenase